MAGQGTREAMADRGARAAMADRGTREAMADRGTREGPPPWRDHLRDCGPSPHLGLVGRSPTTPPKISLGKLGATSGTWGRSRGAGSGGALARTRALWCAG